MEYYFDQNERIENISIDEIEIANPILWTKDVPMDKRCRSLIRITM